MNDAEDTLKTLQKEIDKLNILIQEFEKRLRDILKAMEGLND